MSTSAARVSAGESSGSVFDEAKLEKYLKELDTTEPSIQKLSKWCIEFAGYHASIVQLWLKVFKSVTPKTRLALLYLANDICQVAKRAKMEKFLVSFTPAIKESFGLLGNDPVKEKVLKILMIWKKRATFSNDYLSQLEQILSKKPNKKILAKLSENNMADFKPEEFAAEVEKLSDLDKSISNTKELLKAVKCDFSSKSRTKDKRRCYKMLKECEESSARLTDMLRDIEKQFKRRSTLVSSMETAELFYENQMDQATSVIEHFEKYGARVQSVQDRIEEKLANWSTSAQVEGQEEFRTPPKRSRTSEISGEGLHIEMNQSFFTRPPNGFDQFNDVWSDTFDGEIRSAPKVTATPTKDEPGSFGAYDFLSGLMSSSASGNANEIRKGPQRSQSQEAGGKPEYSGYSSQQPTDNGAVVAPTFNPLGSNTGVPSFPAPNYPVGTPTSASNFSFFPPPSQISNAPPGYPGGMQPPPTNFPPVQQPQQVYPAGPSPLFSAPPPPPPVYPTAPLTVRPYQISGGPISPEFYSPPLHSNVGGSEYEANMMRLPTVNLCNTAASQPPPPRVGYSRRSGEAERWDTKNFGFEREFPLRFDHTGVNQSNLRVLTSGGTEENSNQVGNVDLSNSNSNGNGNEQNRIEISSASHNHDASAAADELEVSSSLVE